MKKFAIVLCAIVCVALAVVPCFAAPAVNPSGQELGGALTTTQTVELYNAAVAQCQFINSSSLTSGTQYIYVPLFITAVGIADQYTYYVYLAYNSTSVDTLPEEWDVAGATITLNTTSLYKCAYNFAEGGGLGYRSYVYAANSRLTLGANEQIVYLARGIGVGLSSTFPYATVRNSLSISPKRWLSAMNAYDGELTEEDVQNSFNVGYIEGESVGYNAGYAAGMDYANLSMQSQIQGSYNSGYSSGFDVGYNEGLSVGGSNAKAWYLDVPKLVNAIPEAARTIFRDSFDIDIFGINITALLSSILVTVIVAFIVRKLVKG